MTFKASCQTLLLLAGVGLATTSTCHAANTQQDRMKACNAQAGTQGVSGSARTGFMSQCLKGLSPAAPAKPATPQERMKACNADPQAKALKGDARKSYMANCLKAG